jgi:hypothetical protein
MARQMAPAAPQTRHDCAQRKNDIVEVVASLANLLSAIIIIDRRHDTGFAHHAWCWIPLSKLKRETTITTQGTITIFSRVLFQPLELMKNRSALYLSSVAGKARTERHGRNNTESASTMCFALRCWCF